MVKRACVAARIVDDEEAAAERIDNTLKDGDDGSGDSGRNPPGWHDFSLMAASRSSPIFAILASSRSLPRAKIVSAHVRLTMLGTP
jgi:hypothetical protein